MAMNCLLRYFVVASSTFLIGIVCSNFASTEFSRFQPKRYSEAGLPPTCEIHNLPMYRTEITALPQGLCPNFELSQGFKESLVFYPNAGFRVLRNYETVACGTENLTTEGYVCPKCRAIAIERKSFSDTCVEHWTAPPNKSLHRSAGQRAFKHLDEFSA